MPSYDLARDRFRLEHRHLGALGYLHESREVPDDLSDAANGLLASGLVNEKGVISPVLSELVATLSAPVVVIQAEFTGPHGVVNHGVVVGADAIFSHEEWPGSPESQYTRIEPSTLLFELARIVGLRKRSTCAPELHVIEAAMGDVDAVFTALEGARSGELDAHSLRAVAQDALTEAAPGLGQSERRLLAELTVGLRSSWRITAVWQGRNAAATEPGISGFAVWDCGELGYWHRALPVEPITEGQVHSGSTLRLEFTAAAKVWELISDVLPSSADLGVNA